MSGTAAGSIVLHVTPESAVGGPLAFVKNGDRIRLSVKNRSIDLLVSAAELSSREAANPVTPPSAPRGYRQLFLRSVLQANEGVDFDFLKATEIKERVPKAT
jgi:dihydroxy-acid dehydratase